MPDRPRQETPMFYRPADGDGLPHNPFNAIVTPRPIGWISTRGTDGSENLAPYSFFNAVAYVPPQVMFASTSAKEDRGDTKDTVANARETGVFCVNVVEYAMRDVMNRTSGPWPKETDEFALAEIARTECDTIPCSRVAAAPANLECRVTQIVKLEGEANFAVFGEVTGVHMRDDCLKDGIFDVLSFNPLTRMGYRDYSVIRESFALKRPGE
jgi:flavin reductase (DIM6/NTAB) family NADH-FMN oxidoreductase RutF